MRAIPQDQAKSRERAGRGELTGAGGSGAALEELLAALGVTHAVADETLKRIPPRGPLIVVVNEPFGVVEGLIIACVVGKVRADVKVAGRVSRGVPDYGGLFVAEERARRRTRRLWLPGCCAEWVRGGGVLVVFPARAPSQMNLKRRARGEIEWREGLGGLVREAEAPVLPVFITGRRVPLLPFFRGIPARIGASVLGRAVGQGRCKKVEVRVGSLVPARKLESFESEKDLTAYLRLRTCVLRRRKPAGAVEAPQRRAVEEVAPAGDPRRVIQEVEALPGDCRLASTGELAVLLGEAAAMPCVLRELGRLREVTFRAAGEGTGRSLDVDWFDEHYLHLFVWNTERKEVVGSYRFGLTDRILERFGAEGLYTSTLFRFKPGLLERINPAVELGRSFVRAEYQRSYAPLMLLWKGIGEFLIRNPKYRRLFGPVSINDEYNSTSRQLMIAFLKQNNYLPELARLVEARTPFRPRRVRRWAPEARHQLLADINDLSSLVSDIEHDRKGVPVLLRQYLRLGGQLISCNIDPKFGNVLDALLLLDLTRADPKVLHRYMGKERAEGYLAHHTSPTAGEGEPSRRRGVLA